jgi:hypothetical protein
VGAPEEAVGASEQADTGLFGITLAAQSLSWEAHHPASLSASNKRYLFSSGLVLLAAVVAYWQSSWLTLVAVLIGVSAWDVRERLSRPVAIDITEHGLSVDGHHYSHAELVSFDIHQMPDQRIELSLKTRRWSLPHLRLPLGEQDHEEVKAVLSQYVLHERHAVPRIEYWLRK